MGSKVSDICAEFTSKFKIAVEESQVTTEGNMNTFGMKRLKLTGVTWDEAIEPADIEIDLKITPKK